MVNVYAPRRKVSKSLSPEEKEAKEDFTKSSYILKCLLCLFNVEDDQHLFFMLVENGVTCH